MKVAVAGLWHLGTVTAACCAYGAHDVIAFDDFNVIANLKQGSLPVDEPGLNVLIAAGLKSGRLRFTEDAADLSESEILWICYDTPVSDNDVADTEFVCSQITNVLPYLRPDALVLISSQLPVGTTARLNEARPELTFAYSPENLRLGKAIDLFVKPDRVVIGVRNDESKPRWCSLFQPFTGAIEWMSIESAEMTKHALNAFLATSISFINEVAAVCETTGADAQQVERGLKSDTRIGPRAYLHPGAAFAGGTLARDLSFLCTMGKEHGVPTHLLEGVSQSNSAHKLWGRRRLQELLGDLKGKVIALLGLTYKPGTDTLRRSSSIETCRWLLEQGAVVRAFDPAITRLPEDLGMVRLERSGELVLKGSDAAFIATPWPEFRAIPPLAFAQMRRALVLDPARHLEDILRDQRGIEYVAIGVSR